MVIPTHTLTSTYKYINETTSLLYFNIKKIGLDAKET